MSAPLIVRATAFEDSGITCMARVYGTGAALVTQSSVTSLTWAATNLKTSAVIVAPTALTVSTVIFDTLQTDAKWTADSTGYNFAHVIPASTFTTGGVRARVEYKVTPVSGEAFWIAWFDLSVLDAMSS